jgi:hypothetical protein
MFGRDKHKPQIYARWLFNGHTVRVYTPFALLKKYYYSGPEFTLLVSTDIIPKIPYSMGLHLFQLSVLGLVTTLQRRKV